MATANPTRRRSVKRKSGNTRLLLVGGAVLLLVVVLWLRRRNAAAPLNTSGTPGPDQTGSAGIGSLTGSGGASGIPNNFGSNTPVSEPNHVSQQVQQNDTTSPQAPQMIDTQPSYTSPPVAQPETNTVSQQQIAISTPGGIGTYSGPNGAGGGKNTL